MRGRLSGEPGGGLLPLLHQRLAIWPLRRAEGLSLSSVSHLLATPCVSQIHPKGTGVVVCSPTGLPAHTFVNEYIGELYPPWRW